MAAKKRLREKVTRHTWPDPRLGPWDVRLTWRLMHGRYECVGVTVEETLQVEGTPPGGGFDWPYPSLPKERIITADVMHNQIKWGALLQRAREETARHHLGTAGAISDARRRRERGEEHLEVYVDGSMGSPRSHQRAAESFHAERKPGRKEQYDEAHYLEVGRVYSEAWTQGHPPVRAVEEHFAAEKFTSYAQAARWVRECRKRGILEPAPGRGRGAGQLLRRGDS